MIHVASILSISTMMPGMLKVSCRSTIYYTSLQFLDILSYYLALSHLKAILTAFNFDFDRPRNNNLLRFLSKIVKDEMYLGRAMDPWMLLPMYLVREVNRWPRGSCPGSRVFYSRDLERRGPVHGWWPDAFKC